MPKLKMLFFLCAKRILLKNERFRFILKDNKGKQTLHKSVRAVKFSFRLTCLILVFVSFSTVVPLLHNCLYFFLKNRRL